MKVNKVLGIPTRKFAQTTVEAKGHDIYVEGLFYFNDSVSNMFLVSDGEVWNFTSNTLSTGILVWIPTLPVSKMTHAEKNSRQQAKVDDFHQRAVEKGMSARELLEHRMKWAKSCEDDPDRFVHDLMKDKTAKHEPESLYKTRETAEKLREDYKAMAQSRARKKEEGYPDKPQSKLQDVPEFKFSRTPTIYCQNDEDY